MRQCSETPPGTHGATSAGPPPKAPFYAVDRSTDDSTVESQGFRDPARGNSGTVR